MDVSVTQAREESGSRAAGCRRRTETADADKTSHCESAINQTACLFNDGIIYEARSSEPRRATISAAVADSSEAGRRDSTIDAAPS